MKKTLLLTLALGMAFSAKGLTTNPPTKPSNHLSATQQKAPNPHSTEANIIGHVIDAKTREYVVGAVVRLKDTSLSAVTDATGHFFLKDAADGRHTLEVKAMGYATFTQIVETKANETMVVNVELETEDVQLGDVVVSATRNVTKRRLAPSLVNVLDMKIFERTQSADLSQALKFQPGVRVENNCQNCGFTQVRINGLDGPYSQILIDSRPVFSSLAGVYGLEQIPTNMIERIEVMRGGGSALFGSSAIAGVINVITKEPIAPSAAFSHETRGIGGLSAFENTTNMNATYVTDNNRLGFTLFGQLRHRSAYDHDGDSFSEMPRLDGRTVGMRAFAKFSDYTRLTAELHGTTEDRRGGDHHRLEPHNAELAEQLRHNNLTGSLNFSHVSDDAKHRISLYSSFMKVNRNSYYGGGTPASELLERAKQATLTASELTELDQRLASYGTTLGMTSLVGGQYAYDFDRLLFMPSQLTIGTEYNHDKIDDQSGFRPTPLHQKVHTTSGFFQNEWKTARWSFLLGGRLDKHSLLSKAIFSPRANVRFNPSSDIVLRANYSAGFRAPQIFDEDLHVDNAGGDLILSENAPGLHEERSHSWSASADIYRNLGDWQLNLTFEGFYTQLKDAFTATQSERTIDGQTYLIKTRTNSDGAKVWGGNFEGRLSYRSLWSLQGGLTLQQSRWDQAQQWNEADSYTTRRMYRTPNFYAYFVSTLTPMRGLDLSLTGNYTGSMLTGHEIPTEDDGTLTLFQGRPAATVHTDRLLHGPGQNETTYGARTFRTPAFFEMGLKIQYTLPLYTYYSLSLYGGVQNLFNAFQSDFDRGPSRDSAYTYGPTAPRSFFLGLKLTY